MTGGTVAILGAVGDNFAAGMTGGMAFVYDADRKFSEHLNPDSVIWQRVETAHYQNVLRSMIEEHCAETGSVWASELLAEWDVQLPRFWQVVPKEMLTRLAHPLKAERIAAAE
jgi:glutamate synthase (NADPH/NADH) large chain